MDNVEDTTGLTTAVTVRIPSSWVVDLDQMAAMETIRTRKFHTKADILRKLIEAGLPEAELLPLDHLGG
jgi:hypothetical protein